MNREHLRAFLWLRWRLRVNQVKRAGTLNAVLTAILAVGGAVSSVSLLVTGLVVGGLVMPGLPSAGRLYVWDGAVCLFLFCWAIGLLADLQRSESLAIDKVLHLPVSPAGAFLINYLSSFFSITLMLFLPGMFGLALGQAFSLGSAMLLALPLLAASVFAVTALTYQFQGWLASMMANPRRRRTIIVLLTGGVILLVQIPNLINVMRPWNVDTDHSPEKMREQHAELMRKYQARQITDEELARQTLAINQEAAAARAEWQQALWGRVERTTRLVNSLLPPGWLPLGAADLADGSVRTALLGTLGLGLIGSVSLWRAYRTTLRIYTTGGSGDGRRPSVVTPAGPVDERPRMVEWKLPWVSEYAAAVATAGLRSLLRAPEAKMMLLTPFIMLMAFGGVFLSLPKAPPQLVGPFIPIGVVGMVLLAMVQLAGNQFGFDRDGFRALVLSPAPRREILLGKNLVLAPLVMGLGLLVIAVVAFAFHLRLDQVAAAIIQLVTTYLLFSMLANTCSIHAPFAIPSGSLKASRPGVTVMLILMGCMLLSPLVVMLPTILPSLVEVALVEAGVVTDVPVSLGLSVAILVVVVWCYRRVTTWQGGLLADREQRILEVVSGRAE